MILRRLSAALLGHDAVFVAELYPTITFECRCGGVTEFAIEIRDIGTWRERLHHEFVRTTCPREQRNRKICAERVRQYEQTAPLPSARLLR